MATPTKFSAEVLDDGLACDVVVEMDDREGAPVYIHIVGLPSPLVHCWLLPPAVARAVAQGIVGVVR